MDYKYKIITDDGNIIKRFLKKEGAEKFMINYAPASDHPYPEMRWRIEIL